MSSELDMLWSEHSENPSQVQKIVEDRITENSDMSQEVQGYLNLFQHLILEHTFDQTSADRIINKLKLTLNLNPQISDFLVRFETAVSIFFSNNIEFEDLRKLDDSKKVRVLSSLVGAFSGKNNYALAEKALIYAISLSKDLSDDDPAHKSLAINSNNLACSLEEMENLSFDQESLLEKASQTALNEWEIAGGWIETERAYYRLASGYLKINKLVDAVINANKCLTICINNSAPALELFFAYEILAKIEKRSGQQVRSLIKMQEYFEKLSDSDKAWTKRYLDSFLD